MPGVPQPRRDGIGNGPRILSRRALEAQSSLAADQRERLVEPLLEGYARNYAVQAGKLGRLFPGTLEGLRELSAGGYKLGVVTNALQHLAETVLARFGIAPLLQIVVGGDVCAAQAASGAALAGVQRARCRAARNPDGRRFDQRRRGRARRL
jgi:phosphoglycolate phosphatase